MLQIEDSFTKQGLQVFHDNSPTKFYVIPEQPRFRLDPNGMPVFKFLKYKFPIERPDGLKGGGFLIFDVEFVVPEDKLAAIKTELQAEADAVTAAAGKPPVPITIGQPTYVDGEVKVNLFNSAGALVQSAFVPAKPSLIGNNVTPVSIELTPEGATLAEQALQGLGGVVQVSYSLVHYAQLPPLKVTANFDSRQFYSFFQTIDIDWNMWHEDTYRETLRESMISSRAMNVDVVQGGATAEDAAKVRDWAQRALEKQVEKKMIAELVPVPDDQRKVPDGIEDVTRDITKTHVETFTINYSERATEQWDIYPQGTLPNITSLKDKQGKPLAWKDFASEIDLKDKFFDQQRVDVLVNADFEKLPIHSVEVKLAYKGKPMPRIGGGSNGEAVFKKPDDLAKFATYVVQDDFNYTYSYQVNYKGTSKVFKSEAIVTDEGNITVGVDDVGILSVDIAPGDINWEEVKSVQVRMGYKDLEEGVGPIEEAFVLTEDKPNAKFQKIIFKPFRKEYTYQVKYLMEDGREFQTSPQSGRSQNLYIDDPFKGRKTVKVVGVGDFESVIRNIFLDLRYVDTANKYNQAKSVVLNADTDFVDWTFPVIDENLGDITYSGRIVLRNGTTRTIPKTTTDDSAIMVPKPPAGNLDIEIITDLLNFDEIKLARLSLSYVDDVNLASATKNFVFTSSNGGSTTTTFPIFDLSKQSFSWKAQYFLYDNSKKETRKNAVTDPLVILELPA